MAIDYVEIEGYKSIKNIKLPLKPINILIGANGAGKSNFISFFEFLSYLYNGKLREYISLRGGQDKFIYHGEGKLERIVFEISFDDKKNGYAALLKKGDKHLTFINEYLIFKNNRGWDIAEFDSESAVKTTDNFRAPYVRGYLKSYRKYHFHDTGKDSPFSSTSHVINDAYFLYEKGENLAAFLFNIQANHSKKYNRIVRIIQSIAPFFSDFYFQPNENDYVRLQWQSKYSNFIYGINDLSDGTIRFIALAVLFLQPNLPSSIIIDEPELGLHPTAISKLAGMVKSVAAKETQVIMATQSADLINHFQAEDVITVDQVKGASIFNRLNEPALKVWLTDYSIGDLWQQNILSGGYPNV